MELFKNNILNIDNKSIKKSIIKIIGIGGAGTNAIERMYKQNFKDVDFAICDTDIQKLNSHSCSEKINIGKKSLRGNGTGNNVEKGRSAALENVEEINLALNSHVKMLFLAAGLGKGTGTGASIEIAKIAKKKDILTIAVVILPSIIDGKKIIQQAYKGIQELKMNVDALIIINNTILMEMYGDLQLSECYEKADEVIAIAVKGISELITLSGYINLDFADVNTVLKNSGITLMGGASASGKDRAITCIKQALASPLLNNNDIKGANDILLNIISGSNEITVDEVITITDYIQSQADSDANLIWGITNNLNIGDKISITIVAAGFEDNNINQNELNNFINQNEIDVNNNNAYTINDHLNNPFNEEIVQELVNETALKRKLKEPENND